MGAAVDDEDTVFITEDHDPDDGLIWTGRFSGYLDRGRRVAEEFEGLSVEEALAWGRARCDVVLVRPGDTGWYFSAGARNPDPEECPPWPADGLRPLRRRARGFEALDNTEDDPPALWDVRLSGYAEQPGAGARLEDVVRAHPRVSSVQVPAPGYPELSAAFLISAPTQEQAKQIADEIVTRALGPVISSIEIYAHRPGVSVRGPGITY
jgi:hypothetical protein